MLRRFAASPHLLKMHIRGNKDGRNERKLRPMHKYIEKDLVVSNKSCNFTPKIETITKTV